MLPIINLERPDSADAVALITELEAELEPLYPSKSRHGYSVQKLIEQQVDFFVVRDNGSPAGCGGVQFFSRDYGELKRMYIRPAFRGRGLADRIVEHLSAHALANDIHVLRLETGIYQAAAIRMYERNGFYRIPPFGDYQPDPLSLFFEKTLGT